MRNFISGGIKCMPQEACVVLFSGVHGMSTVRLSRRLWVIYMQHFFYPSQAMPKRTRHKASQYQERQNPRL